MKTHLKPILATIAVYLIGDGLWSYLFDLLGLGELHAFFAMFFAALVGGYLARQGFVAISLGIAVVFSFLTYVAVSMMREQSVISLIAEQSLFISIGPLVGAVVGAWIGQWLAARRG